MGHLAQSWKEAVWRSISLPVSSGLNTVLMCANQRANSKSQMAPSHPEAGELVHKCLLSALAPALHKGGGKAQSHGEHCACLSTDRSFELSPGGHCVGLFHLHSLRRADTANLGSSLFCCSAELMRSSALWGKFISQMSIREAEMCLRHRVCTALKHLSSRKCPHLCFLICVEIVPPSAWPSPVSKR